MEGTIYLNKNKKDQNQPPEERKEQEELVASHNLVNMQEQSVSEDKNMSVNASKGEDEEESSWKPGFLQPEERLIQEASEIANALSPDKVSAHFEKQGIEKDLSKTGENFPNGNNSLSLEAETIKARSSVPYGSGLNANGVNSVNVANKSPEGLSEPFFDYLERFKIAVVEENKRATNPIFVDEIATKVAQFYESVRRVIDWKEEHLVRRAVIDRVLKRKFVSKLYGISILPDVNPEEAAEPFVMELVRTGYFPNGKIAREKIYEIQKLLTKYLYILNNARIEKVDTESGNKKEIKAKTKERVNFYNWVISIASCEIEEVLDPPLRETALLDLMTRCLLDRIKVIPAEEISEEDKYIQTYISVHKTLFNLDEPIISFHVLRYKYPEFCDSHLENSLPEFADKIFEVRKEIEGYLNYPKASEFYVVADKYDAPYLLIGDAMNRLADNIDEIDRKVLDKPSFLSSIEVSYKERLATLKKRLSKLAIFSTLSIFVAGFASLLIFEIPIAKLVRGYFSPWAIAADLGIPTALMFILVWMIKPPSDDNLDVAKNEVEKIVYKSDELDVYEIELKKKSRKFMDIVFAFFYTIGGLLSLCAIFWVFKLANVPWTSMYIDTVNVAMIVASAMVIRRRSKEITVVEKANMVEFFLDFFSIPLAKIGNWFSEKWREYNVVSAFFTALIDLPFSTFVAAIEGWRNFIKEKRIEIK